MIVIIGLYDLTVTVGLWIVALTMRGRLWRRYGCLGVVGSENEMVFQVETSSPTLASWSSLHRTRDLWIVARAIGWCLQ